MLDRFSDGDPRNNGADFDMDDPSMRHGGDLAGLLRKLNYIQGLGFTALWIGPVNLAWEPEDRVQLPSYHHYHPLDWTLIDKRLGTLRQLQELVAAAHARGMLVLMDIVPNHVGARYSFAGYEGAAAPFDVHGGEYPLVPIDPSRDYADLVVNNTYDPTCRYTTEYAGSMFTYQPLWRPDIGQGGYCNSDLHHNGDCALRRENWDDYYGAWASRKCRFFGVLDVYHDNPRVVDKFVASICAMIDSVDIDGLRVDAVHVHGTAFSGQWIPRVRACARRYNKLNFFIVGEVWEGRPLFLGRGVRSNEPDAPLLYDSVFHFEANVVLRESTRDLLPFELAERISTNYMIDGANQYTWSFDWFLSPQQPRVLRPVNIVGSHDPLEGFDPPVVLQTAYAVALPGLASLRYGMEQEIGTEPLETAEARIRPDMHDNRVRRTPRQSHEDGADHFDMCSPAFRRVQTLLHLRHAYRVLAEGEIYMHRALEEAPMVFSRYYDVSPPPAEDLNTSAPSVSQQAADAVLMCIGTGDPPASRLVTVPTLWDPRTTVLNVEFPHDVRVVDAKGQLTIPFCPDWSAWVRVDRYTPLPPYVRRVTPAHDERVWAASAANSSVSVVLEVGNVPVPSATTFALSLNGAALDDVVVVRADSRTSGTALIEALVPTKRLRVGLNALTLRAPVFESRFWWVPSNGTDADADALRTSVALAAVPLVHTWLPRDAVAVPHDPLVARMRADDAIMFRVSTDFRANWSEWLTVGEDAGVLPADVHHVTVQYWFEGSAGYSVDYTREGYMPRRLPSLFVRSSHVNWTALPMVLRAPNTWSIELDVHGGCGPSEFIFDVFGDRTVTYGSLFSSGPLERHHISSFPMTISGTGHWTLTFNDRALNFSVSAPEPWYAVLQDPFDVPGWHVQTLPMIRAAATPTTACPLCATWHVYVPVDWDMAGAAQRAAGSGADAIAAFVLFARERFSRTWVWIDVDHDGVLERRSNVLQAHNTLMQRYSTWRSFPPVRSVTPGLFRMTFFEASMTWAVERVAPPACMTVTAVLDGQFTEPLSATDASRLTWAGPVWVPQRQGITAIDLGGPQVKQRSVAAVEGGPYLLHFDLRDMRLRYEALPPVERAFLRGSFNRYRSTSMQRTGEFTFTTTVWAAAEHDFRIDAGGNWLFPLGRRAGANGFLAFRSETGVEFGAAAAQLSTAAGKVASAEAHVRRWWTIEVDLRTCVFAVRVATLLPPPTAPLWITKLPPLCPNTTIEHNAELLVSASESAAALPSALVWQREIMHSLQVPHGVSSTELQTASLDPVRSQNCTPGQLVVRMAVDVGQGTYNCSPAGEFMAVHMRLRCFSAAGLYSSSTPMQAVQSALVPAVDDWPELTCTLPVLGSIDLNCLFDLSDDTSVSFGVDRDGCLWLGGAPIPVHRSADGAGVMRVTLTPLPDMAFVVTLEQPLWLTAWPRVLLVSLIGAVVLVVLECVLLRQGRSFVRKTAFHFDAYDVIKRSPTQWDGLIVATPRRRLSTSPSADAISVPDGSDSVSVPVFVLAAPPSPSGSSSAAPNLSPGTEFNSFDRSNTWPSEATAQPPSLQLAQLRSPPQHTRRLALPTSSSAELHSSHAPAAAAVVAHGASAADAHSVSVAPSSSVLPKQAPRASAQFTVLHVAMEGLFTAPNGSVINFTFGGMGKVVEQFLRFSPVPIGLVTPLYGRLMHADVLLAAPVWAELRMCVAGQDFPVTIRTLELSELHRQAPVTVFLVQCEAFDHRRRDSIYTHTSERSELTTYALFAQAVAHVMATTTYDVTHFHDYHGALAPLYLLPALRPVACTVHNGAYQGAFPAFSSRRRAYLCSLLNLDTRTFCDFVLFRGYGNMIHALMEYIVRFQRSNGVCTVSPRYALTCMQTQPVFWKLAHFAGILNGTSDQAQDAWAMLSPQELAGRKRALKRMVQRRYELLVDPEDDADEQRDSRLLCFMGRQTHQKGMDIIADAAEQLLRRCTNAQLVVVGPVADPFGAYTVAKLRALMPKFPGRLFADDRFVSGAEKDELLGGADFFLCPSRFEPCGLVDVEAAATGGLSCGFAIGGLSKTPGFYARPLELSPSHLRATMAKVMSKAVQCERDRLTEYMAMALRRTYPVANMTRSYVAMWNGVLLNGTAAAHGAPCAWSRPPQEHVHALNEAPEERRHWARRWRVDNGLPALQPSQEAENPDLNVQVSPFAEAAAAAVAAAAAAAAAPAAPAKPDAAEKASGNAGPRGRPDDLPPAMTRLYRLLLAAQALAAPPLAVALSSLQLHADGLSFAAAWSAPLSFAVGCLVWLVASSALHPHVALRAAVLATAVAPSLVVLRAPSLAVCVAGGFGSAGALCLMSLNGLGASVDERAYALTNTAVADGLRYGALFVVLALTSSPISLDALCAALLAAAGAMLALLSRQLTQCAVYQQRCVAFSGVWSLLRRRRVVFAYQAVSLCEAVADASSLVVVLLLAYHGGLALELRWALCLSFAGAGASTALLPRFFQLPAAKRKPATYLLRLAALLPSPGLARALLLPGLSAALPQGAVLLLSELLGGARRPACGLLNLNTVVREMWMVSLAAECVLGTAVLAAALGALRTALDVQTDANSIVFSAQAAALCAEVLRSAALLWLGRRYTKEDLSKP